MLRFISRWIPTVALVALLESAVASGQAPAATGVLGTANVHVDATGPLAASGDLQIVVVAGLAERLSVVAGEPEEVTPDV